MLAFSGSALAVPPSFGSLSSQDRHPAATFSAPRASSAYIYLASKPDRATDGDFLSENVEHSDSFTDSEIQGGQWLFEYQVDPGAYWVMLRAFPEFGSCYLWDGGGYDPACAKGHSDVMQLVVPRPTVRYTVSASAYRYLRQASLEITARPLGERVPYRLCYRLRTNRNRCLAGRIDGYSWSSSASDTLSVHTGALATFTTFTWYVGGEKVAVKRVRVR